MVVATARKASSAAPLGQTNPLNWRLDSSDSGRHVWHYIRDPDADSTAYELVCGEDERGVKSQPQSLEAKHALGLPLPTVSGLEHHRGHPYEAARKGQSRFAFVFIHSRSFPQFHQDTNITNDFKRPTVITLGNTEVSLEESLELVSR